VLIGRPDSQLAAAHKGEDPIQALFDQLRQRRLASEQIETFARQEEAASKQRELNEARASADKQAELTGTRIDVDIAANRGEAQLAEARRLAERDVARANGEARARELLGAATPHALHRWACPRPGSSSRRSRPTGIPGCLRSISSPTS